MIRKFQNPEKNTLILKCIFDEFENTSFNKLVTDSGKMILTHFNK